MSPTVAKKWCSRILFESIPTCLLHGLRFIWNAVFLRTTLQRSDHEKSAGVVKVYDLVNCGPMNQFMVGDLIAHNCSYGAGAGKIHETLQLAGIEISLNAVRQIHRDYWRLFAGVKQFEERLRDMWASNGGWIPNALGRPLAIAPGLLKDACNRFCQASGHDMLQLFIWNLDRLRRERNLQWYPWIIDLHDEVIVECSSDVAPDVAQSFIDALAATNEELGMAIQLKGDPQIADTLADIKIEG